MRNKKKYLFKFKKINQVIRFLTISDFLLISGWGLMSPIFAVFIVDSIPGGDIKAVGIATMIFLLTKSIVQIPAGILIDIKKGERDDFWYMFIGSVAYSIVPILYLFTNSTVELYAIQFFYGLVTAFTYPTWYAIFTRHVDKNQEGYEWGIYNTLTDLGASGAAVLGGLVAASYGFYPLFISVSIVSFIGSMFILFIYKEMRTGGIFFKK